MKKSKWKPKLNKASGPKDPDFRVMAKRIQPASAYAPEMKVVLYGKAGTGKTTLAASFPKPAVLLDFSEKGTDSVRDVKGLDVLRVREWDEVDLMYWYIKKGEGKKYKTIILDTMSHAQEMAIKKLFEDRGVDIDESKIGGWGTMRKQDWGTISTMLKRVIFDFRDLEDRNVIFIAHDRINKEDENEDEDAKIDPSVGPRLMPSVASVLNAAVSVIGNTFIRERFKTILIGKKKKEKRIVEYCLRIGPHAIYTTKVRKPKEVSLPDILVDPDYDQILELMRGEKE